MKNNGTCPICSSENTALDLYQIEIPVLQNRVFDLAQEAVNSSKGIVSMSSCNDCTFVYNSLFNNDLIVYDTNYDNDVPSKLFTEYYHTIAQYLYDTYDLKNGVLYDVGCGKGTFLKILCDKFPDVKGIGIDPSYEGKLDYSKNLTFIPEFFDSTHALEKPSLIISRHVFEHIEKPVVFLKFIAESLNLYKNVPFFIEVPDLAWIIQNEAFWDVCYEHCNYFNPISLGKLVTTSESNLTKITPSFNNQYLWCEGILNPSDLNVNYNIDTLYTQQSLKDFTTNINELKLRSKNMLTQYKRNGFKLVIWGMATKGIEFCNIVDSQKELIDFCVDINSNKQGKYIPFTGHKIEHPETILNVQDKLLIVIMNPNYYNEIKKYLNDNNVFPIFISGHGEIFN